MEEREMYATFKKIVAVHLTNYFPRKKCIKPRFVFQPFYIIRDTTHFTLNTVVEDLSNFQTGGSGNANWSNKLFAVLAPFDGLYALNGKNLQSLAQIDTFFTRVVKLPVGTVVLILPDGIDQAIREKITTQAEAMLAFGEYAGLKQPTTPFFEKIIEGIQYRIYNWHMRWYVKQEALRMMNEMGYAIEPLALHNLRKEQGIGSKPHDLHWTRGLEEFSIVVHKGEEAVKDLLIFLAKIELLGISLPTTYISHYEMARYGFPIKGDPEGVEKIIDAESREFSGDVLDTFSIEEVNGSRVYDFSVRYNPGKDSCMTLLGPIIRGRGLLKTPSIPKMYHKIIILWIKNYQRYIREHVPMSVIILMPGLQEGLSDSFLYGNLFLPQ